MVAAAADSVFDLFKENLEGTGPASIEAILNKPEFNALSDEDKTRLGCLAIVAASVKRSVVDEKITSQTKRAEFDVVRGYMRTAFRIDGRNQDGLNWTAFTLLGHMLIRYSADNGCHKLVTSWRKRLPGGGKDIWHAINLLDTQRVQQGIWAQRAAQVQQAEVDDPARKAFFVNAFRNTPILGVLPPAGNQPPAPAAVQPPAAPPAIP